MKSVPTAVGRKMEGAGDRGVRYVERAKLWQEDLGDGTESRFKLDMLFESQQATSSATGLQSAELLLWHVPEMQQRNYFCNIPCGHASKEV